MNKPIAPTPPPPWQQPHLLALAAVVVMLAFLFAIPRSALAVATVFERLFTDGLFLLIWIASAWGWGAMIQRIFGASVAPNNRPLALATSLWSRTGSQTANSLQSFRPHADGWRR